MIAPGRASCAVRQGENSMSVVYTCPICGDDQIHDYDGGVELHILYTHTLPDRIKELEAENARIASELELLIIANESWRRNEAGFRYLAEESDRSDPLLSTAARLLGDMCDYASIWISEESTYWEEYSRARAWLTENRRLLDDQDNNL